MPKIVPLKKPLTTHQGTVNQLEFRDPTGSDFVALNALPFGIQREGDKENARVDFKAAMAWMTRLSGHDDVILGKLDATDFMAAVAAVNQHLAGEAGDAGNSGG